MTLPLTIIGGYLGAGKTTLVNHLLRHADGLRLAVLVNEFGALPIDEDLIEAQDDAIISIAGGCVCCSYGNDLTLALMDMTTLDPPPDHVLLEASGVALPGAIAASVSLLQGYTLDGIVTLCNAETIREHARDTYIGDTVARQITDADLIVLNKTDLIDDARRRETEAWLGDCATGTEVIAAHHGALPPDILLQSFIGRPQDDTTTAPPHANLFRTLSLEIRGPVDADALARGLADPELGLVRAKGFVEDGQGTLKAIQVVGRRWAVTDGPPTASPALVVIGKADHIDERRVHDLLRTAASRQSSTTV